MIDIRKKIGNAVRRLAAEQGVTLERLAYENNISKGYIYDVANGKANLSVLMLQRIAHALKVKPKDLL